MPRFISTDKNQPHAILLALGPAAAPHHDTVAELSSLLVDLGFRVVEVVRQRRPTHRGAELIGPGTLAHLKSLIEQQRALGEHPLTLVLVGQASPGQLRWLEQAAGAPVIDRTEVILRVFESRARTRLAHLEIELARCIHELPRVRDNRSLDGKHGGGGRGGRGHTNVELAKQRLRKRIAELRKAIALQRAQRQKTSERRRSLPRVALVGYTNAGKSSWMRALTGSSVLVEDKLFATLDTTVRALAHNPGPRILVSDTVGFMGDLPHPLLESFRSTLEEALDADLLLHVADASHPKLSHQIRTTHEILDGLSTRAARTLLLLNKADRLTAQRRQELQAEFPDAMIVSSRDRDDVHEVTSYIRAFVEDELAHSDELADDTFDDEATPRASPV